MAKGRRFNARTCAEGRLAGASGSSRGMRQARTRGSASIPEKRIGRTTARIIRGRTIVLITRTGETTFTIKSNSTVSTEFTVKVKENGKTRHPSAKEFEDLKEFKAWAQRQFSIIMGEKISIRLPKPPIRVGRASLEILTPGLLRITAGGKTTMFRLRAHAIENRTKGFALSVSPTGSEMLKPSEEHWELVRPFFEKLRKIGIVIKRYGKKH